MANKLIFVDMPTDDLDASRAFYEKVFGWSINLRESEKFLQVVPGDGLHLGIFDQDLQRPDPSPGPDRHRSRNQPRIYILVEDEVDDFVDTAVSLGATELWRKEWWQEFEGYHASFLDPWGNQIIMWQKERDEAADAG